MNANTSKKFLSIISAMVIIVTVIFSNVTVSAATYHSVKYTAGDVDNIIGSKTFTLVCAEGLPFQFANSSRFSRKGYKLVSWYIKNTNETVGLESTYVMPSYDLDVQAIWAPAVYTINFAGVGGTRADGSKSYNMSVTYGTPITLPENSFTYEGHRFNGWSLNGDVYQPGETFNIPPLLTGEKLVFSALWVTGSEPVATTATTTAVTTTTTTTTVAETPEETTTLADDQILRTYECNYQFNSNNEIFKDYLYSIMDSNDTIDALTFNFSANNTIGNLSLTMATTLSNGQQCQRVYQGNVSNNKISISLGSKEECNMMEFYRSIQVGLWYSGSLPLTLDSITAVLRVPEQTTTASKTTKTPKTTTTTTTTTTVPETTTETTTTSETTTTAYETTTKMTTTTAEITTTETTTTTAFSLSEGQYTKRIISYDGLYDQSDSVELNIGKYLNDNETADAVIVDMSANSFMIGYLSMSYELAVSNGNCTYSENKEIDEDCFSYIIDDAYRCNAIKSDSTLTLTCNYSQTYPIYIDSITLVVRENEVTEITTTTETITTTTTTTTTTSAPVETTTTSSSVTYAPVTNEGSKHSRIIVVNKDLTMGGEMLSIDALDIANKLDVIENIEVNISSDSYIGNYNIGVFMNMANSHMFQKNFSGQNPYSDFAINATINEDQQDMVNEYSKLNIGYWYGDRETITIDSIVITYSNKADMDDDGIVTANDANLFKKMLVGNSDTADSMNIEEHDINDDGEINVFDSLVLERAI